MANQDILLVSKLADSTLELVINAGNQENSALELAFENWKDLCEDTVANIGISKQVTCLQNRLGLDKKTLTLMCLILLPQLDARYLDYYARLSGTEQAKPTPDLVASIVSTTYADKSALLLQLETRSPLVSWKLLVSDPSGYFALGPVEPSGMLIDYFNDSKNDWYNESLTLCSGSPLNLTEDNLLQPTNCKLQIIRGGFEERQLTKAIRLANDHYRKPLFRLHTALIKTAPSPEEALQKACVYALLQNGLIYWQDGLEDIASYPALLPVVHAWLSVRNSILFMGETSAISLPESIDPFTVSTIQLAPLNRQMEKEIWQSMGNTLLGSTSIDWELVSNTYAMNMARIGQTLIRIKQKVVSDKQPDTLALQNGYMATSPFELEDIAYLNTTPAAFSDMVLADPVLKQLTDLETIFLTRHLSSSKKGVIAVFQGNSGTGKTMAAESLASALKLPLYRIDYALLETKPEASLRKLFDEASINSAALLFDEADALFSLKNDPNGPGNATTALLIQLIENYEGLLMLTTNASQKIDPAFLRRATSVITFPEFTPQQRLKLFQKLITVNNLKLDDTINLNELVITLPLSGRSISNIINTVLLLKPVENTTSQSQLITASDMAQAIKKEMI